MRGAKDPVEVTQNVLPARRLPVSHFVASARSPQCQPLRSCEGVLRTRNDGSERVGAPLPYGFPCIPSAGLSSLPLLCNANNAMCLGLLSYKQTSYGLVCWCDKQPRDKALGT